MKEAYVSFDVAKLLKEKGFDWVVDTYYCDDYNYAQHDIIEYRKENYNSHKVHISAPTQQMACRWLRKEKGIHISADIYKDSSNDADGNIVEEWTYWAWDFYWLPSGNIGDEGGYDQFDSYEDAVEAALQYCLTNLI